MENQENLKKKYIQEGEGENGTLEYELNGKKEKLNFYGKPFVKNLDFNIKNPINFSIQQLYTSILCICV